MTNETATTTIDAPALAAVQAASAAWIRSFNAGDTDACVAGYTEDAVMEVASVGRFEGHAAIDGFWRPFMAQGAGALVYEDVRLRMVDPSTVELSARWSMNVGGGVIT
ncbi:MAG: nuclear transport factor 2 family protein, partial [Deltaproteobacteria bacterium]|nr:nuclear transport factor 2 family protein [Deltaproteobacteria bacterium]